MAYTVVRFRKKVVTANCGSNTTRKMKQEAEALVILEVEALKICLRHGLAGPPADYRFYATASIRGWSRSHLT